MGRKVRSFRVPTEEELRAEAEYVPPPQPAPTTLAEYLILQNELAALTAEEPEVRAELERAEETLILLADDKDTKLIIRNTECSELNRLIDEYFEKYPEEKPT